MSIQEVMALVSLVIGWAALPVIWFAFFRKKKD